ncbi:TPA: hypothetical protein U1250_000445 [Streptococcus suis]|nr:hypothetical protein [Streptococcus suis]HEM5036238.1 hypothetical protein [Streptococcus suis]HEM5112243.1 hypothetical protein [Streptococcus suis]HEM5670705.1 hypothetical protein [Streptococcus suis]
MKINEINFGNSDGQLEAAEENFTDLFYKRPDYEYLKDSKCFLIIGRKGTGKTILSAYFVNQSKNYKEYIVNQKFPNDFKQKKLISFAQDDINRDDLSLFWEYVFYLDMAEGILDKINQISWCKIKKFRKLSKVKELTNIVHNEQYKIEKIVNGEYTEHSLSQKFSLSATSSVNSGLAEKTGNNIEITKTKSKYYENLSQLKKLVKELLSFYKYRIVLFYDDMEKFEEEMGLQKFISLMNNMIYVADIINKEISLLNNSKICLVVREDIINILQSETGNLNKQVTDLAIRINWFAEQYSAAYEHPLMQMVLNKIRNSSSEFNNKDSKYIYDSMFESKAFEYLMDRGFGRPRDLIVFLNMYKKRFGETTKLTLENFRSIEQEYSSWLNDELMNEISISDDKKDIMFMMDVISRRGYASFTIDKICNFMEEQEISYESKEKISRIIEKMRELDIIGIRNKKKVQFNYRLGKKQSTNNHSTFIVHRGFKKYLNLS